MLTQSLFSHGSQVLVEENIDSMFERLQFRMFWHGGAMSAMSDARMFRSVGTLKW